MFVIFLNVENEIEKYFPAPTFTDFDSIRAVFNLKIDSAFFYFCLIKFIHSKQISSSIHQAICLGWGSRTSLLNEIYYDK